MSLNNNNDERTTHSIPIGSMTYAEYVCIIFGVAVSDWTGWSSSYVWSWAVVQALINIMYNKYLYQHKSKWRLGLLINLRIKNKNTKQVKL